MKILVVDDDSIIRKLLTVVLIPLGYEVETAVNGEQALQVLENTKYDMVLLDVMMPGISGYDTCSKIKEKYNIPVVMLTALNEKKNMLKSLECGADEFLTKPFEREELKLRIRNILKIKEFQDNLEELVKERTGQLDIAHKEVLNSDRELIHRLLTASEYRDDQTGKHIVRVGRTSRLLAEKMGCENRFCELIEIAAPMHDIGKIGISDLILLKPGKFSDQEYEIMKTHAYIGAKILENSDREQIKMAHDIALNHHEKWDGTGYPGGKKGEDIPLSARITALADVFDALVSKRSYKQALGWDAALKIITDSSAAHFDEKIVGVFLKIQREIADIYNEISITG